MVTDPEPNSFEEFWPQYVRNHSIKSTRVMHMIGVGASLAAVATGLLNRRRRWLIALAPALGVGPAWIGHLVFQGSRPATFDHPLWALKAETQMIAMAITGTLSDEIETIMAAEKQRQTRQTTVTEANESPWPSEHGGGGPDRQPPPTPFSVN